MKTITAKIPEKLSREMEKLMKRRGYSSQSELLRDAIRRMMEPELDERILREIVIAREQIKRGKTVPLEEIERKLRKS
jgi:Arc/MetJ-type ribon-helix-helix transcriptional regulator